MDSGSMTLLQGSRTMIAAYERMRNKCALQNGLLIQKTIQG